MLEPRGAIFSERAYALGKMLDHSAWLRDDPKLPRLITPSDLDIAFDNAGSIIFVELSSSLSEWRLLQRGQRMLYQSAIENTAHLAALCVHDVDVAEQRPICSRNDITRFQLMLWDYGFVYSKQFRGNKAWQETVRKWFENPLLVRRKLLALYGQTE